MTVPTIGAVRRASELEDSIGAIRLSDVTARRVEWLWPGRLPLGKLVMFDGDPGAGKSTVFVDLAARLTTGSPMPDGYRTSPSNVVLVAHEDGVEDTIRPRFDAAGGDPTRVELFDAVRYVDGEGRHGERLPQFPLDVARLEFMVQRSAAALVVLDVLTAYLGKTDSHRDADVRGVLAPLARMADETGCTIVALRHLTKGGGANPLYRGGGSIAFTGQARVVLLAGTDPEDDSRRILAVSKSNLAAPADALAYRLVDSPEQGCARVEWLGTTSHRASDLLVVADQDDDTTDAAAVLTAILEDGPMWVKHVIDAMAEAGFSKDQAKRAKRRAGVRSEKVGAPGDPESGWQWSLARREHEGSEESGLRDAAPLTPFVLPSEGVA